MMTRKRPAKSPEYAVSDEAAAYIADALMELRGLDAYFAKALIAADARGDLCVQ